MYEHFTDAENTGAPLVPSVEEPTAVRAEHDRTKAQELDEVVFSHRIQQ